MSGQLAKFRSWLLLGLTIVVAGLVVLVTIKGSQLGAAASAIVQAGSVVLSIYGGVVFTQQGNDQHIRDAARASVRRVLANYTMLGRLATIISEMRSKMAELGRSGAQLDAELVEIALKSLQDQVQMQIISADAAIQDWRDLAPAEVDQEVTNVSESLSGHA
jgi:hypothetical protein